MENLENLVAQVSTYAEEAAEGIMKYYTNRSYTITQKKDNSPVTEADWEAHLLLLKRLQELSSYPVISEESYKLGDEAPHDSLFWLVDPLDGTKEFIRKTGSFTVNIALIDGNYPILGVVYVPTSGELFYASRSHGAFKRFKGQKAARIQTRRFDTEHAHLLLSRYSLEEKNQILKSWPQAQITVMGSSLKYCRIAEGAADLYVRRHRTFEWDTAAAQCILEEAGGGIYDLSGERLRYRKAQLENRDLIALGDPKIEISQFF